MIKTFQLFLTCTVFNRNAVAVVRNCKECIVPFGATGMRLLSLVTAVTNKTFSLSLLSLSLSLSLSLFSFVFIVPFSTEVLNGVQVCKDIYIVYRFQRARMTQTAGTGNSKWIHNDIVHRFQRARMTETAAVSNCRWIHNYFVYRSQRENKSVSFAATLSKYNCTVFKVKAEQMLPFAKWHWANDYNCTVFNVTIKQMLPFVATLSEYSCTVTAKANAVVYSDTKWIK